MGRRGAGSDVCQSDEQKGLSGEEGYDSRFGGAEDLDEVAESIGQLQLKVARSASNSLRHLCADSFGVEGVETHAAGHKKAVFLFAAKAEVRAWLGQVDFADEVAVGGEDFYAIVLGGAPA